MCVPRCPDGSCATSPTVAAAAAMEYPLQRPVSVTALEYPLQRPVSVTALPTHSKLCHLTHCGCCCHGVSPPETRLSDCPAPPTHSNYNLAVRLRSTSLFLFFLTVVSQDMKRVIVLYGFHSFSFPLVYGHLSSQIDINRRVNKHAELSNLGHDRSLEADRFMPYFNNANA